MNTSINALKGQNIKAQGYAVRNPARTLPP